MMKIKPRDIRRRLLSFCPLVALFAVLTGPGQAKAFDYDSCLDWCAEVLTWDMWFCGDIPQPETVNQCIDDAYMDYDFCILVCEYTHEGGGEDQCSPTDWGCDPFYDF